ncbi:MAG: hypothetical protein KDE46_16460 [Caldilineaceae bacterium]|nr:hypothetical protein [Caldilineaceae bacterium]
MSNQVIIADEVTFEQVFSLAQQLRLKDQVRLIARLAPKVEWMIEEVESATQVLTRKPLRGLLADRGPAPSVEEIDEVQHEMWATLGKSSYVNSSRCGYANNFV